jgi:hypothetical protein
MFAGYRGFERAATAATGALMQDEMLDIHRDRWQLKHFMGVRRRKRHQLAVAAGTGTGHNQVPLRRAEQRGALAGRPLAPASLP